MYINNYFNTTIWSEQKPEFVKSLTKASNKYIKAARNFPEAKAHIKKFGDFGRSYHSTPLTADNDFIDFRNYIGQKSWEYLDHQGFDMQQYTTLFSEMWVQEFAKKGGTVTITILLTLANKRRGMLWISFCRNNGPLRGK